MPKTIRILLAIIILLSTMLAMSMASARQKKTYTIDTTKFVMADTTPASVPDDELIHDTDANDIFWDSEQHWMSMALQLEAGVDWPDWAVIMIGDVIMHRIASPDYPDTVKGVLLDPGQYEPFFGDFELFQPEQRYIDLAERILNGESCLTDMDILYQALFPQGQTIVTYYDEVLGTTTYFCK